MHAYHRESLRHMGIFLCFLFIWRYTEFCARKRVKFSVVFQSLMKSVSPQSLRFLSGFDYSCCFLFIVNLL